MGDFICALIQLGVPVLANNQSWVAAAPSHSQIDYSGRGSIPGKSGLGQSDYAQEFRDQPISGWQFGRSARTTFEEAACLEPFQVFSCSLVYFHLTSATYYDLVHSL